MSGHRIRPEYCVDAELGIELSLRAAKWRQYTARRNVIACARSASTDEEHKRCQLELDESECDVRLLEELACRLRGEL